MGLGEYIDFHKREVISIIEFAGLWSDESGNSLSEIFEFLKVVLKKRQWLRGYVKKADGSNYFHGRRITKTCTSRGSETIELFFKDSLFFVWLEQARDSKDGILDLGYCLQRNDYITLLKSENIPIPSFLLHPSVRPGQPPQPKRSAIASTESKCRQWLAELMRQGPQKEAKAKYKNEALQKFFDLSERGFDRAWSGAIIDANAADGWGKPGRKVLKSNQRI
jgi:hypothetical protein